MPDLFEVLGRQFVKLRKWFVQSRIFRFVKSSRRTRVFTLWFFVGIGVSFWVSIQAAKSQDIYFWSFFGSMVIMIPVMLGIFSLFAMDFESTKKKRNKDK